MFSCTEFASGVSYLDADFRIRCYHGRHWSYLAAAAVWLFVVPLGVPVVFILLLYAFKVPQMAALMTDNAWLQEGIKLAMLEGVAQPPLVAPDAANVDDVEDIRLEVLYAYLVRGASREEAADILAGAVPPMPPPPPPPPPSGVLARMLAGGQDAWHALHAKLNPHSKHGRVSRATSRKCGVAARRAFLLNEVLLWCKTCGRCAVPPLGWFGAEDDDDEADAAREASKLADADAAPAHDDDGVVHTRQLPALRERALKEVGFLFSVYRANCWYFETLELLRKLLLTSVLSLIATNSASQVVVGVVLAFSTLLLNLKLKPYFDKALNFVSALAQLNLLAFFFVGLLLKVNVDGRNDSRFFDFIVGALCAAPIALPVVTRVYLKLYGDLDARNIVKDAASS